MHSFLLARADVSSIALVAAQDYIDVALLHALVTDSNSDTPRVAIVGGQASLAAAAKARIYSPDIYYSWCVSI